MWLRTCKKIGKEVRKKVMPIVGTPKAGEILRTKKDNDTVRTVDLLAENTIVKILKTVKADFTLYSEELGKKNFGKKPRYTLFIDPLDGSGNAVRGIPFFCVSIAVFKDNKPYFAYVIDLPNNSEYWAFKGKGAYKDGRKIKPLLFNTPKYVSVYLNPNPVHALRKSKKILETFKPRYLGAVALDLCLVAAGAIDGLVDLRNTVRYLDYAAGMIILEETGGIITDSKGKPLPIGKKTTELVAANKKLHKKIIKLVLG